MYNVKDLIDFSDYGDNFVNYDSGYIGDIITEIADNQVDIYTSDLIKWNAENFEYTECAVEEFGMSSKFDMLKAIQMGQFLYYEEEIYNNLDQNLYSWAMDYILNTLHIETLSEDEEYKISDLFTDVDNNNKLEDYIGQIEEILSSKVEN